MIETGTSDDPAVEQRLTDLLTQMYGFYYAEIDMSLDRVKRFLHRLGDPHLHLPRTVHVAGTNGKGSVIATLRSALETAGMTVHCATSPHLVHPTERIRLSGKLISSEALIALLEECLTVNRDEPITFFEMFMAASFLAFARTPADYLLLETGMGGRLDATNVVTPACTVITTISHDHEAFLGSTLRAIAGEKAGIMKRGVPCVIGYQTDTACTEGVVDVFASYAQTLHPPAPLIQAGADWRVEDHGDRIRFTNTDGSLELPRPSLIGAHQIRNAGAALAAFKIIEPHHFTGSTLSTALTKIVWPGRLQLLCDHWVNRIIPGHWQAIVDGGHNDSGGQVLAEQAQLWAESDPRPLHLIVAMVNRKDPAAFLGPLAPYATSLTVTQIPGEKESYAAGDLYEKVRNLGFREVRQAPDAAAALKGLVADYKDQPARILLCGSLYFIGSVLKEKAA